MKQRAFDYSYELKIERKRKITRNLLIALFISVFLIIFFKTILFPVFTVSKSMSPDLERHSLTYFSPVKGELNRGDLVLLKPMEQKKENFFQKMIDFLVLYLTAQQVEPFKISDQVSSKYSVRRVIGKPGDSLYMKNYIIHVKPAGQSVYLSEFEVSSRDYTLTIRNVPQGMEDIGISGKFDLITLGPGEYFVAADNRVEALDSRYWGPVNEDKIAAIAFAKYFPFKSARFYE